MYVYIKHFTAVFICIQFFILLRISGTLSTACTDVPISISHMDVCEDGQCSTQETAFLETPLTANSSACLRFSINDKKDYTTTVTFTVVSSKLVYNLFNCYYTDDPSMDYSGYCSCTSSNQAGCANSNIHIPPVSSTICKNGFDYKSDCPFTGSITPYWMYVGLTGHNHIKLCEIASPKLILLVKITQTGYPTVTKELEVHDQLELNQNTLNITFLDFSYKTKLNNYFVMFDVENPQDFWLVKDKEVNDINQYDPSKLGWFKSNLNPQINGDMSEFIGVSVQSCVHDQYTVNLRARSVRTFVQGCMCSSQMVLPSAILRDKEYPEPNTPSSVTDVMTTSQYKWGQFITLPNDNDIFLGIEKNGEISPSSSAAINYNMTMFTIKNSTFTGDWSCSSWFYTYWASATNYDQVRICRTLLPPYEYSLNCVNRNPLVITSYGRCSVRSYSWPHRTSNLMTISKGMDLLNDTVPTTTNEPGIIEDIDIEGHFKILINFKNLTIQFINDNVVPHIIEISEEENQLLITVESLTVSGNCLIFNNDGVAPPLEVVIERKEKRFMIPLSVKKYNDWIKIYVQCYKQIDAVKFKLDVDNFKPELKVNTIQESDIREASEPKKWYEHGWGLIFWPLAQWWNLFLIITNWIEPSWLKYILWVFLLPMYITISVVLLGAFIYIIYRILKYLILKLWYKIFPRSQKELEKELEKKKAENLKKQQRKDRQEDDYVKALKVAKLMAI